MANSSHMATTQSELPSKRLTYLFLCSTSASVHFFTRRISVTGFLIPALFPVSCILLLSFGSNGSLRYICALLFIIPLVSSFWLLFRKCQINVTRITPTRATVDEKISYQVILKNETSRPVRGASVLEMEPDNRPTYENFLHSKEPGEETRNIFDRNLCYYRWEWLQGLLTKVKPNKVEAITTIPPKQSITTTLTTMPSKRGVILMEDLRICLHDPLGLFQRFLKTTSEPNKITVLPKRYQIPSFAISSNAQAQSGGENTSQAHGYAGDFTGVRDYKPGDPPRHIHWKSWARTGTPIVKEYENTYLPRYGIALDTCISMNDIELFEIAVSVAASYISEINNANSLVETLYLPNQVHSSDAQHSDHHSYQMLEVLANVVNQPELDYQQFIDLILKGVNKLTAIIVVLTDWDEQHCKMIKHLHGSGLVLHLIAICDDIDTAQRKQKSHPSPVAIKWVRTAHVQHDLLY